MSREIKFRAWDGEQMLPPQDLSQSGEFWSWLGKKDVKLMQFTGLTDSKGTPIYEGDIVRVHQFLGVCDLVGAVENEEEFQGVVVFHEKTSSFGITGIEGGIYEVQDGDALEFCHLTPHDEWIEVIGNIHQHKHLLE